MKETVNLYSGTKVRFTEKILVRLFIYQAVGGGGGGGGGGGERNIINWAKVN